MWVNYPSSAADLQKSAHIVFNGSAEEPSRGTRIASERAYYGDYSDVANLCETEVNELKEARRQYLLGAKKNRQYVASTLFYGRFDQPKSKGKLSVQGHGLNAAQSSGVAGTAGSHQNNIKYITHPLKMLVIQK